MAPTAEPPAGPPASDGSEVGGDGERPPFSGLLGSWRNLHALVLVALAVVIALLSLFTWSYR